jgi:hypothetical protein
MDNVEARRTRLEEICAINASYGRGECISQG